MPTPTPEADILHITRGRLRLRIKARRRDTRYFSDLATWLDQQADVQTYAVNPLTATVLLCHRESMALDEIAQRAAASSLFKFNPATAANLLRQTLAQPPNLAQGLREVPALKSTLAAFYVVMIAHQISRGDLLAPASTLLDDLANALKMPDR